MKNLNSFINEAILTPTRIDNTTVKALCRAFYGGLSTDDVFLELFKQSVDAGYIQLAGGKVTLICDPDDRKCIFDQGFPGIDKQAVTVLQAAGVVTLEFKYIRSAYISRKHWTAHFMTNVSGVDFKGMTIIAPFFNDHNLTLKNVNLVVSSNHGSSFSGMKYDNVHIAPAGRIDKVTTSKIYNKVGAAAAPEFTLEVIGNGTDSTNYSGLAFDPAGRTKFNLTAYRTSIGKALRDAIGESDSADPKVISDILGSSADGVGYIAYDTDDRLKHWSIVNVETGEVAKKDI